jgi:CheY-like chemotaxis protein
LRFRIGNGLLSWPTSLFSAEWHLFSSANPNLGIEVERQGRKLMRVLLLEDHEETRVLLERFVTRCGYDVLSAGTLKNGLNLLQAHQFGAILSDIALPDGTGYALISEARRRGIDALAVALSVYNYPEEVREAKLTGFDYHLTKPYDCAQLRSLLEQAAARAIDRMGQYPLAHVSLSQSSATSARDENE